MRIFLSGDVMTGRGVDQILSYPSDPRIHEPTARSAKEYVRLAEQVNGPISYPVTNDYIWGVALDALRSGGPSLYIVNLETAITHSEDFIQKGINYRMNPENAGCLTAAGVHVCILANNHILDWNETGLIETLDTLNRLKIKTVGAGRNIVDAARPVVINVGQNQRVIVYAAASATSGTPDSWMAGENKPGVNVVRQLSDASAANMANQIADVKRPGDIVIFSIHWGPNWGYLIPQEQVRFAHQLIDEAGVSVVFGHSSHHPKAIEWYRNRLICYGCGDFLNDYEGITGYEEYRDDLVLLYAITFAASSEEPIQLELVPFRIRRFQLTRPSEDDAIWLQRTLDRENSRHAARIAHQETNRNAHFSPVPPPLVSFPILSGGNAD